MSTTSQQAAAVISTYADELRQSHTLLGEWSVDDWREKAEYDYLKGLAAKLDERREEQS